MMRIQDVELQTGLDRATIRFYEKEGILQPKRLDNGYRQYSDEDVSLLMKIKLLRQLGVSLHAIRCLQKGSATFDEVLVRQIQILEEKINQDTKAKYVCKQIHQDGVSFSSLNAQLYLEMFQNYSGKQTKPFEESFRKEIHPWRRYIARMLDYTWIRLIILIIIASIIRVRPLNSLGFELIGFISYYISVPIIALFLHLWGTTPGKWLMGIRIESINGGKLSLYDAFSREGYLLQYGMGFFLPCISQWRMILSYKEESNGEQNNWNDNSEIIYTECMPLKRVALAAFMILSVVSTILVSYDTVYFPQFRREHLTIAQFSENHFDYEKMFELRSELYLGKDGTWQSDIDNGTYYLTFDDYSHERPEFEYTMSRGGIQSIHYSDSWISNGFEPIIPAYCEAAVNAFIGSRPTVTLHDMIELSKWNTYLEEQIRESNNDGTITGEWILGDVRIRWYMELDGCDGCGNGFLFSKEDRALTYSLDLTLEVMS